MSETFSSFGKTKSRSKGYAVAAAVLAAFVLASIGVCSAAVQDEHDQGKEHGPSCGDFVYVVNGGSSNSFSAYRINPFTGNLESVPGSPFVQGILFKGTVGQNGQLAVNTRNKILYAVSDFVLSYPISPDGALSGPLVNMPIPDLQDGIALALDPGNHFLYAVGGQSSVLGLDIDEATGELTSMPGSPFASKGQTTQLSVDPTDKFLYVLANYGNTGIVSGYAINPSTGALTPVAGSPFTAGDFSSGLAVDPSGRFIFVTNIYGGNGNHGNITGFHIDRHTGALSAIAGSPFALPLDGGGADAPVIDSTGRFLYVPLASSNNIAAYHIHPFTGELTPFAEPLIGTGPQPIGAAVDSTGRFLYVTNQNDGGQGSVHGYLIEPYSGALRPLKNSPFPSGMSTTSIVISKVCRRR
jgi:6-phosphogluconolactonase